jgi:diaminohydroxyphosphoribosylaminopyrimidine deaminase/5-amino-6-(5-phosphoribosylamino)uracil reductase
LLVEGGSQLYSAFLEKKLADEIHFFLAPKILGGGLQSFSQIKFDKINIAIELEVKKFEQIGRDYYFETEVKYAN